MVGADEQGNQQEAAWWATGDFPARAGCVVHPLIDGRAAMLAMCRAFLSAREFIVLAGWDIRTDLPMVRGSDAQVGASDSPEQQQLLASLRADGLDDDAVAFWNAGNLTVRDVLGFAAGRGVRVGVLLWDAMHWLCDITNDPAEQQRLLAEVGVDCLLDDSSRRITHLTQSLHQKCTVVDGRVAFIGGVDLTAQSSGDYDRWDTHRHLCSSPVRLTDRTAMAHPWHDVHVQLHGPAVTDVLHNIVQRWGEVAERRDGPRWPLELSQPTPAPLAGGVTAQVVRTIPPKTYEFAEEGIETIRQAYQRALGQARRFVYIENQYLWPQVFLGLDQTRWGGHCEQIEEVLTALAAALERGVHVAIVLPDHPNCGRRFTDAGIDWLREHAPHAEAAGRLDIFTLGNADSDDTQPGGVYYRPVYVHAKVAIVDDTWWTAGSANLNSRGLLSDAEINMAVLDPATARGLRQGLWGEHLSLSPTADELADPLRGLDLLRSQAQRNQTHVERRERLEAHILPYLTEAEGKALNLPVDPEHGWLDALEGSAGALPEKYAHRYV